VVGVSREQIRRDLGDTYVSPPSVPTALLSSPVADAGDRAEGGSSLGQPPEPSSNLDEVSVRPVESDAAVAHRVAEALDRHVPADDLNLARWRHNFAKALASASTVTLFEADNVAENADAELLDGLDRLVARVTRLRDDVRSRPALRLVGGTR
jgi:hypothetical protein